MTGGSLGVHVEITSGARAGEKRELAPGIRLVVGREETCDLALADERASRRHFQLSVGADGSVVLEDLGSTNGTFVDGVRVSRPVTLRGGEELRAGSTLLVVRTPPGARPTVVGVPAEVLPRPAATVSGRPWWGSRRVAAAVLGAMAVVGGAVGGVLAVTGGGDEDAAGTSLEIGDTPGEQTVPTERTVPETVPEETAPEETAPEETAVPEETVSSTETATAAALEALLARVPEEHRATCLPELSAEEVAQGVVMQVRCEVTPDLTAYYSEYATAEALAAAYEARLELESVPSDSGDCSVSAPGEGAYTLDGDQVGRLVCYESQGWTSFDWTHEPTLTYARALSEGDAAAVYGWWTGSGRIEAPAASPPATGRGAALETLLGQIPETHRETCLPFYAGDPAEGVAAGLKCRVSASLDVYYTLFDSLSALQADYADTLDIRAGDLAADSGDCSQALPGEGPYTIDGETVGRLACYELLDSVWFDWTHEPTLIAGSLAGDEGLGAAWEWWSSESGPIG